MAEQSGRFLITVHLSEFPKLLDHQEHGITQADYL